MLPGFRFLFAAIVLSMSVLVFGLGAAALLRAAHEEFISSPSWRAVPETVFAQPSSSKPVLALLSAEPAAPSEPKSSDHIPVEAADPAVVKPPPIATELTSATLPSPVSSTEAAEREGPPADLPAPMPTPMPVPSEPASAERPVAAAATTVATTDPARLVTSDAKPAASEAADPGAVPEKSATPEHSEPVAATDLVGEPAPPESAAAAPSTAATTSTAPALDTLATKLATLGDAPVAIQHQRTESEAKSERLRRVAATKRLQARIAERRRIAQRARAAAAAATPLLEPFKGPYMSPSSGGY